MDSMKTVIGLFDDFPRAHAAVDALLFRKFDRADVSLIANEVARSRSIAEAELLPDVVKQEGPALGDRRTAASAGGMLGMLAGFGALTLPAIGPILATGPMLGMLAGVAVDTPGSFGGPGGLVAALEHVGAPRADAEVYAEGVRRGGSLVIVRVVQIDADVAAGVLADNGAVDIDARWRSYEDRGFTGFDPGAEPYTAEEIDRERALYGPLPADPDEDEDDADPGAPAA